MSTLSVNNIESVVNLTVANTITIGNSTVNTIIADSALTVGNSTVNSFINATSVVISSSTPMNMRLMVGNSMLTGTSLSMGNSTVNSFINSSSISFGNSTANVLMSGSQLSINGQNVSPVQSFRNKFINGNFDIWQRGTTGTSGYVADRWNNQVVGSTAAISRQSFTLGQTDVPNEPSYFHRVVVTSVAGAGNYCILGQKIESVRNLAGQTATFSFWAKADASKNIAIEGTQYFGTGGSPSTQVNEIGVTTCALTTSWQKFTVTFNIPSISGKTLGTNNDDSLILNFWFDAGSNWDARNNSLGQQSGTFDIAQVQLEAGSVATPFEMRPVGVEFQLCQRYYQVYSKQSMFFGNGHQNSTTQYDVLVKFDTPMRRAPSASLINQASVLLKVSGGGTQTISTVTAFAVSETACRFYGSNPTTGAAGYGLFVFSNATGAGIQFSAEL